MRIAVNMVFGVSEDQKKAYRDFMFQVFKRLTNSFPGHQFLFLFDRQFDTEIVFSHNITPVILRPAATNSLLWKFWLDAKIPKALKKYQVDAFVSAGACSSSTKVPQCLLINGLLANRPYTTGSLRKATILVTTSEHSKQEIFNRYHIQKEKIIVVYAAAREGFEPASSEVADSIRNKYTDDKAYFLCVGCVHPKLNPLTVLKAFSIFKKRQRSNMRLVLIDDFGKKYKSFAQSLKTYKYRDDVIVLERLDEEELTRIAGSAYAVLCPSLQRYITVLEVMKCGVPLMTSLSSATEVVKDAALYVDTKSVDDIAEKMMLIYKDENLRNELIEKGKTIASHYSWQRTAEMLWESILKAVG